MSRLSRKSVCDKKESYCKTNPRLMQFEALQVEKKPCNVNINKQSS